MAGRTIVVTGASDGIGARAAKRSADEGEKVVVGHSPRIDALVNNADWGVG